MARPHDSEKYDLSDAEKRDLIKLIEQGKPLPEKYRFLLFADKREVELVWNGKSREVCTAVLPFQTLEHIDEPRKEQRGDGAVSYTHLDVYKRQWSGRSCRLCRRCVVDVVNVHELFGPVDRIKNPPVADGILMDPGQVGSDRFMTQIVHVGGQPFRLVEQPLSHGGIRHA